MVVTPPRVKNTGEQITHFIFILTHPQQLLHIRFERKIQKKRLRCKYRCVTHQPRSHSKSYVYKGVRLPGRTFKGLKEHQHLGLNKDELTKKSEEEIHDRQWGQCLRKKEVTHCAKYPRDQQLDSHWWPLSSASEERHITAYFRPNTAIC